MLRVAHPSLAHHWRARVRLRQDGERRGAGRRNTLTHAHAPAGSLLHLPALLLHLLAAALVRIVERAALVEVISRVGPGRINGGGIDDFGGE